MCNNNKILAGKDSSLVNWRENKASVNNVPPRANQVSSCMFLTFDLQNQLWYRYLAKLHSIKQSMDTESFC